MQKNGGKKVIPPCGGSQKKREHFWFQGVGRGRDFGRVGWGSRPPSPEESDLNPKKREKKT